MEIKFIKKLLLSKPRFFIIIIIQHAAQAKSLCIFPLEHCDKIKITKNE